MFGFETHEQSVFCSTDFLGEMCLEALNGRLIDPKTLDRIVGIY